MDSVALVLRVWQGLGLKVPDFKHWGGLRSSRA